MARRDELATERRVVFDDAVVDHRQPALAIQVWVGVGVGDPAVGRPARVTQRRSPARQAGRRLADLACVFFDEQARQRRAILPGGDAP